MTSRINSNSHLKIILIVVYILKIARNLEKVDRDQCRVLHKRKFVSNILAIKLYLLIEVIDLLDFMVQVNLSIQWMLYKRSHKFDGSAE